MDHESAKKIAEGFVRAMERSDASEVFAEDVFCDINVPEWRFQMQGVHAVAEWLRGEQPDGCRTASWRSDATSDGVVVEIDQRYDRDGTEISSRNLHRLEVRDGKITEWTMYCTGEWTPELRERQAREAPMLKP
jgi:ketosteroid isomerase-like protein